MTEQSFRTNLPTTTARPKHSFGSEFAAFGFLMAFWIRTWQLGVKSLMLHPLRSLLTVLGIFIGVASVIWLLAIGEGISQKAQEQIAELGADNIIVPDDQAAQ